MPGAISTLNMQETEFFSPQEKTQQSTIWNEITIQRLKIPYKKQSCVLQNCCVCSQRGYYNYESLPHNHFELLLSLQKPFKNKIVAKSLQKTFPKNMKARNPCNYRVSGI